MNVSKDILRLILFNLKPLDMFQSVSGVCRKFREISHDETYWERKYEEECSERLKETLDRVELRYRTIFLFFILNNPLNILFKHEILNNIKNECKLLVEYMIKSLEKNERGVWFGNKIYFIQDKYYYVMKSKNNGDLILTCDYRNNILNTFGFQTRHKTQKYDYWSIFF